MDETIRSRFYAALQAKAGLTVGDEQVEEKQLRALFRLPDQQMRQWQAVLEHLLRLERQSDWSMDASRKYFLVGDRMVQAWRLIIRADQLDKALDSIATHIKGAPNVRFQLTSVPLPGVRAGDRNTMGDNGRGARPTGGSGDLPPPILGAIRR